MRTTCEGSLQRSATQRQAPHCRALRGSGQGSQHEEVGRREVPLYVASPIRGLHHLLAQTTMSGDRKRVMPWEKPVPHHKWADELESEAKTKKALKDAKRDAKNEDHTKECPFCHWIPVTNLMHPGIGPEDPDQERWKDMYKCPRCERTYRANCPGTILLDGDTTIVQYPGQ